MDDLENPNTVAAKAELLREVRERTHLGANLAKREKLRPAPTFVMRLVLGCVGALFAGVMLLVYAYPALSLTMPYYWAAVGFVFIFSFSFGHLARGEADDV